MCYDALWARKEINDKRGGEAVYFARTGDQSASIGETKRRLACACLMNFIVRRFGVSSERRSVNACFEPASKLDCDPFHIRPQAAKSNSIQCCARQGGRVKMADFFLIATVTAFVALPVVGQNAAAPKPTLGPSAALLASWNEIGHKLIAMAEDFPEDKYDFKPTPTQRSFAEQLLHTAGSNDHFTDVANGKKPKDDESRAHFKTKTEVVAYVKKSFADGAAVIKEKGDKGMTEMVVVAEGGRTVPIQDLAYGLIEHSGEHYGQLVVYYRLAGMVPPESRPQR